VESKDERNVDVDELPCSAKTTSVQAEEKIDNCLHIESYSDK
jgi:hypothetical protein